MTDLSNQKIATIIAALRHYQQTGLGITNTRVPGLEGIATNEGEFDALSESEIDSLCEELVFCDQGVDSFNVGFVTVNCPHCHDMNDATGDLRGETIK
jgi:cytochrome c peroxidase